MSRRGGRKFTIEVVSDTKKFTSGMKGFLRSMSGTMAGLGVAMGGREIIRGIQSTIMAASDLHESMNAVEQVFGSTSQKIKDFGRISAHEVGLSTEAFQSLTTVLGSTLLNKGLDDAAGATIELTQRASDMASVFNTDVSQAMEAIGSLFQGQSRPIRQYGVNILQADIQARALADTGKTVAGSLTNQEKANATLALVMEQTSATAGDFKNTSDDLANSTRILTADWQNFQAELGKSAIPAAEKGVKVLTDAVERSQVILLNSAGGFERMMARIEGMRPGHSIEAGERTNWAIMFDELEASTQALQDGADLLATREKGIIAILSDPELMGSGVKQIHEYGQRMGLEGNELIRVLSGLYQSKELDGKANENLYFTYRYLIDRQKEATRETLKHRRSIQGSAEEMRGFKDESKLWAGSLTYVSDVIGTATEATQDWGDAAIRLGDEWVNAQNSLSEAELATLSIYDVVRYFDTASQSLRDLRDEWSSAARRAEAYRTAVKEAYDWTVAMGRLNMNSGGSRYQLGDSFGPQMAPQSLNVTIQSGIMTDPVEIGREVQTVLAAYAGARGSL